MNPDVTAVTTLLANIGTAGIFIIAWFRSEKLRDDERQRSEARYDAAQKMLIDTQTSHRREMLQLIRDITFGKSTRDLADTSDLEVKS